MPPKAKKDGPSKKTEMKKKEKTIEDKTFGLKNKKGNKQQKFIQHVQKQVIHGNKSGREMEQLELSRMTRKEQKKKEQDELNALFKPVEQKVGKGADPKSVLCAFFKQGLCTKGDKCKFSHDLLIGRKAEKRSIYEDKENNEKPDSMEDWDENTLKDVIDKRHGQKNKSLPKTSIVCKYFLDAVENSKYGWFWSCPNGESCHYRHALPPGFVLKKDKKKMEEQEEAKLSLEELIETERAALSSKNLTKVTLESFMKWKDRKRKEKIQKAKQEADKKKQDFKSGRTVGISGRLMFEFNPDLMAGDDEEASTTTYTALDGDDGDEEEDATPVKEFTLESLSALAQENDGSGTMRKDEPITATPTVNGIQSEEDKLAMAAALDPSDAEKETDEAIAAAVAATIDGINIDEPIDENLFDGEDLDLVEEELENLDLAD